MYSCLRCSTTMLREDTGKRFYNVSNLFFAFSTFLWKISELLMDLALCETEALPIQMPATWQEYVLPSTYSLCTYVEVWQSHGNYTPMTVPLSFLVSCLVGKSYIDKSYTFSRMQIDHWIAIVGRDLEIIDTTFPANAGTYNRFTDRHPERFGISL